jgi:HlyD family secretion protein
MKQRWTLIGTGILVVVALAIALVSFLRHSRPMAHVYSGTVETREIQIGSKVGGRATEVLVEEGQTVTAGTLLVRFESDDLKAQREQAAAAVGQAQSNLQRLMHGNRPEEIAQAEASASAASAAFDKARNGPRQQEIAQAQADLAAAQADAVNAEATFHRMEKLVATDTISRLEFDNDRARRDAAAQKAESARQRLALLQAGTRKEDLQSAAAGYRQAEAAASLARKGSRTEDISIARDELASAQANRDALDVRMREAELAAPANGVIEVVGLRPGDLVPAGRIVVTMLELSQLWVKVYVPETDLSSVHVGQAATVVVDGLSGHAFNGHIGQIASQAEFLPRNVQTPDDRQHQVIGVKVFVDNPEGALKSGMSATVRLQ